MDISILKYLDVLIGLAVVMILASSFVTLLTQFVLSVGNRRSLFLEKGITSLLKRAEPRLADQYAEEVAKAVVEWQPSTGNLGEKKDVVVREQLISILLEIVTDPDIPEGLSPEAKAALAGLFTDPTGQLDNTAYAAKLLETIERKICVMEAAHPEFASHVIQTRAIIEADAGKFVDAVMTRFDGMSESLSTHFSANSRRVTFLVAMLLALALPLDTIDLLQRLSSDNKLRDTLITEAINQSATHEQAVQPSQTAVTAPTVKAPITLPASAMAGANALADIDFDAVKTAYQELNDPSLGLVSRGGWANILSFNQPSLAYYLELLFGCFLSALLMTIGAPFWFELLKNLLKLRPNLAKLDDDARQMRMSDETAPDPVEGDKAGK